MNRHSLTTNLPGRARKKAKKILSSLLFWPWQQWSRRIYGSRRPLAHPGMTLYGLSHDRRAYRLHRGYRRGKTNDLVLSFTMLADKARPDVVFDVGANYGEFTSDLALRSHRVVAVEANPQIVECLQSSFLGWSNVETVWAAVAGESGNQRLFVPFGPGGYMSSGTASLQPKRAGWKEVEVPSRRLDRIAEDLGLIGSKCVLLKIDIEGLDLVALQSAERLLRHCDVWRALIEFHPDSLAERGLNAESIWRGLSRFPGVVVRQAADFDAMIPDADSQLPNLPGRCDVLLGQGSLGSPA